MRSLKMAALLTVAAMALTACGSGGGDDAADGKVKIRFSYWGSDSRQKLTEEVIAAFEKKNPDIDVVGEFSDWQSYYESLATKVAAGDAPDVMTLEIRGLAEYAGRGAIADLTGKVDTAALDQDALAAGQVDGKQYAIPTGVNVFAMYANKSVLEKAGVELPDDKTWTWDDYIKLSAEISKAGKGEYYGTEYTSNNPTYPTIYAAQRGEKLYDNGKIGITADTLKAWWGNFLTMIETKASPDAAKMNEIIAAGVEQSLIGTNKGAFGMWWSNQLGTLAKVSGSELAMLRMPKLESGGSNGMFLQPAMHWTISSKTGHPAEAQKFVEFLINDPEAGGILLSDRGLPINSKVLEAIKGKLTPADQQSLEFIDEVKSELSAAVVPPKGASKMEDVIKRYTEAVTAGQMTPDEAAGKFLEEANAAISG